MCTSHQKFFWLLCVHRVFEKFMVTIVINTLLSTYTCTSPLCATVADRILCHVHPYIQSAVSMNPLLRTRLIQCTHFVDMIQLFSTYSSQSCCQFPSPESYNADSLSPSNQPSIVSMRVCVLRILATATVCEWALFHSELPQLFKGSFYSKKYCMLVCIR